MASVTRKRQKKGGDFGAPIEMCRLWLRRVRGWLLEDDQKWDW